MNESDFEAQRVAEDAQWQSLHFDEKRDINISEFEHRMNICRSCDKLKMAFCSECGCFMPIKTRLKNAECPLKKWV